MRSRTKRAAIAAALCLAVTVGLYWWQSDTIETGGTIPPLPRTHATSGVNDLLAAHNGSGFGGKGPLSEQGLEARKAQLTLWQGRFDRAEQVLASYRDSTRYPHSSRPIKEHPDQVRPFDPIAEELTLRNEKGETVPEVRLRTTQDRVFVSGIEVVKFTLQAVDLRGNTLPLTVRNAAAQAMPDSRAPVQPIQTRLEFSDTGQGVDLAPRDGVYSAAFSPSTQGFSQHSGTVRVLAEVSVSGKTGFAQYDVVYTPEVPAQWLGVREALEGGSLNFYIKLNVRQAGRYVVSGRVDAADGTPFALLQFNDELPAGTQELRLQLFGALIHDFSPRFPLRLRDVDGFLLLPDTFPDRAMLPRRAGVMHTSSNYSKQQFSTAEWTSEERERYLKEYGKDADEARKKIIELGGG